MVGDLLGLVWNLFQKDGLLFRLLVFTLCLYGIVAAYGPLRFCSLSMNLLAEPRWDPPPKPLVPVLSWLSKLFRYAGTELSLTRSFAAEFRAGLHGPAALFLASIGLFFCSLFFADKWKTVMFSVFTFSSPGSGLDTLYEAVLIFTSLFLTAAILLCSRTVVRWILRVDEQNSDKGQEYTNNSQEDEKQRIKKIGKVFPERYFIGTTATGDFTVFAGQRSPYTQAVGVRAEEVFWQDEHPCGGKHCEGKLGEVCGAHLFSNKHGQDRDDSCYCKAAAQEKQLSSIMGNRGCAAVEISVEACEKRTEKNGLGKPHGENSKTHNLGSVPETAADKEMGHFVKHGVDKKGDAKARKPPNKDERFQGRCALDGHKTEKAGKRFRWSHLLFPLFFSLIFFVWLETELELATEKAIGLFENAKGWFGTGLVFLPVLFLIVLWPVLLVVEMMAWTVVSFGVVTLIVTF